MVRMLVIMVLLVTVMGGMTAQAGSSGTHMDLEIRGGAGVVCGLCRDRDESAWRIKPTAQLFADVLFPVWTIGPGTLELGPYAKGALLDDLAVPQVAGGLVLGYRWDRWEVLVNGGLAYATERIGVTVSDQFVHQGQTKHTYDLGIAVRYDIARYFVSLGYTHNSNGVGIGLNYAGGKGFNPGYDQLFLGLGIRF